MLISSPPPTEADAGRRSGLHSALLPPVAIGLLIAFAFVGLYTTAFHSPRPHDLRLGVVAPPAAAEQLGRRLDAAAPGAFAVSRYASERAARGALLDRDVDGVLLAAGPAPRVLVASAAGPATGETITAALAKAAGTGSPPDAGRGSPASANAAPAVEDVRPLPASDARGLSTFFTIVGTTLASVLFGVVLFVRGRAAPTPARVAATLAFAGLTGLTVALTADVIVGALDGPFWGIAGTTALLSLAVAATTAGLTQALGPAGIGLAALVLLVFGMSSSGGPVGDQFIPGFYATFAHAQPAGAALAALRNVVYFGGAATLVPVLVLIAWALAGALLELAPLPARRRRATA